MVARAALLVVEGHFRRRAARLDLRAHLLQARSNRFDLLLLVRQESLYYREDKSISAAKVSNNFQRFK